MKYSDAKIKELLDGIYSGRITEYKLPDDLYYAIADYLKRAVYEGYGQTLAQASGKDLELLAALRENIYRFSAAKTFQQVKDIAGMLIDENGEIRTLRDFNKIGAAAFDLWNKTWGATEYITALGQAQEANRWTEIERNKDILPNLKYVAVMDPNTSEICRPLDGIVAPVDSKIWDKVAPLNHFRCRCVLVQVGPEERLTDNPQRIAGEVEKEMQPLFKMNAGRDQLIFKDDHPYYDVAPREKPFKADNFGLPIPSAEKEAGKPIPVPAARSIEEVMAKAREAGPQVDRLGKKFAKKYDGIVTPINYKKAASIERKLNSDLMGDITQLKDAVRNTVVVDYNKFDAVIADMKKDKLFSAERGGRIKVQDGPGFYGYKGILTNFKARNGLTVEMQVNSPGMIYAKVDKADALNVMSEKKYNEIAKKTGLPGGMGHKYYDQIRVIDPQTATPEQLALRADLVKKSEKYYAAFYGF